MNPRIAKDVRAVLPAFVLTLAGAIVMALLARDPVGPMMGAFVFGSILMGAMILGADVRPGLLSLWLTQPLPRRQLWREKMQVLAVALGAGLSALLLGVLWIRPSELSRREFWLPALLTTLCAFCTTPFWTLLYRSTLVALLLSMGVPTMLMGFNVLAHEKWIHGHEENSAVVVLLVYCGALGWLGWRRFRNLQLVDAHVLHMERELVLPPALEGLLRPLQSLATRWRGPLAALFKKELRLQLICLVAAGLFCLVAGTGAVLKSLYHDRGDLLVILSFGFYVPMLPLLAGTVCVGEEKSWGVSDWHLTLPPSIRRQWWIKVATALFTSFTLGFLLPWACYWGFREVVGIRDSESAFPSLPAFLNLGVGQLLLTSLAILAATIASNTARALALAAGFIFVAAFLLVSGFELVAFAVGLWNPAANVKQTATMIVGEDHLVWLVPRLITAELFILLGIIHRFAYRCYRTRGLVRGQFTLPILLLIVVAAVFALVIIFFSPIRL